MVVSPLEHLTMKLLTLLLLFSTSLCYAQLTPARLFSDRDIDRVDTILTEKNRLYVILTKDNKGQIYQIEKDRWITEKIYEFDGSIGAFRNVWYDADSGYYSPFTVSGKSFVLNIHNGRVTKFDVTTKDLYRSALNASYVFYARYSSSFYYLYKHDYRMDTVAVVGKYDESEYRFDNITKSTNPKFHITDTSFYLAGKRALYRLGQRNKLEVVFHADSVIDSSMNPEYSRIHWIKPVGNGWLSVYVYLSHGSHSFLFNPAKNDSIVRLDGNKLVSAVTGKNQLIYSKNNKVFIREMNSSKLDSIAAPTPGRYFNSDFRFNDSLIQMSILRPDWRRTFWSLNTNNKNLDSLFTFNGYPVVIKNESSPYSYFLLGRNLIRSNGLVQETAHWTFNGNRRYFFKYGVEFGPYFFLVASPSEWTRPNVVWAVNFNEDKAIKLQTFFDLDDDGVKDSNEYPVSRIGIYNQYNGANHVVDENGELSLSFDKGTYKLEVEYDNKIWKMSNDTITVSMPADSGKTIYVPLAAGKPTGSLITNITSTVNRCNRTAVIWFNITNYGNRPAKADCKIELDKAVKVSKVFITPSAVNGNELEYKQLEILPFQTKRIKVWVRLPGWNGSLTDIGYSMSATSKGVTTNSDLSATFRCAYDPNDKLVFPLNDTMTNVTQLGTPLTYTVRFQNTGNDTAFNVRITDTLSKQLDWETFRLINASHSVQTQRDKNGVLNFMFSNIMLPDSNIDEPGSHGYVKYRVYPKKNLKPGSVVYNKAHIYFDFNPDIETNTTTTTYDFVVSRTKIVSASQKVALYPNPLENQVSFDAGNEEVKSIGIYTVGGQLLELHKLGQSHGVLKTSHFEKGVYIFRFETHEGTSAMKVVK